MNTREHFKKQGLSLDWGKHKVVIKVGREKDKIVCSPKAFRYLKRAIEALNDIGYVDPILEGEMLDAEIRKSVSRKGRRDGTLREAQLYAPDPYLEGILAKIKPDDTVAPGDQFHVGIDYGVHHSRVVASWPEYDDEGNLVKTVGED